jgi:hypothetical protein
MPLASRWIIEVSFSCLSMTGKPLRCKGLPSEFIGFSVLDEDDSKNISASSSIVILCCNVSRVDQRTEAMDRRRHGRIGSLYTLPDNLIEPMHWRTVDI